ncbi:hypothetical protein AB0C04_20850 [Micromonospora sp. NPDC048909]|uniref:hypothetical protein n=1 Tax=Micromonospora sp. NPDC048909 TaxID=3155643 RepID=UPI0033DE11F0
MFAAEDARTSMTTGVMAMEFPSSSDRPETQEPTPPTHSWSEGHWEYPEAVVGDDLIYIANDTGHDVPDGPEVPDEDLDSGYLFRGGDVITADDGPPDVDATIPGDVPEEFGGSEPEVLEAAITRPDDASDRSRGPHQADPVLQDRVEQAREEPAEVAGGRPGGDQRPDEVLGPDMDRPRDAIPRPHAGGELGELPRARPPVVVVEPALWKTQADAIAELDLVTRWHRLVDQRMPRVERLVDRVRKLPAVRATPDLLEELNELRLAAPDACMRTVGCVLAELIGLNSAPDDKDGFDEWMASLDALADEADRLRPIAVVSPDARGEIDGQIPTDSVSEVEIRDSVGVMWGAHNQLHVEHLCVVESPVIEVAELIDLDGEVPVFGLSAWRYSPARRSERGQTGGTVETSATLHEGYWANIWNCAGITIGDRNSLDLTYIYRMTSCRVNLVPLLRDPEVRADLARCRDSSPENAAQAQQARQRLPVTVSNAVNAIDVSSLVAEEEIAALAAQIRQPRVRGRSGGIVITHGVGVALGIDPAVSWRRATRIDAFQVR